MNTNSESVAQAPQKSSSGTLTGTLARNCAQNEAILSRMPVVLGHLRKPQPAMSLSPGHPSPC